MSTWICSICNIANASQDIWCEACFNNLNDFESSASPIIDQNDTADLSPHQEHDHIDSETLNESKSDHVSDDETYITFQKLNLDIPSTPSLSPLDSPKTPVEFDSKSSVDPVILSKLHSKQHLLFHGFLRFSHITDIIDNMYIPSDIIALCYTFFELNISAICIDIHRGRVRMNDIVSYDDLYELAMVLRGQRDCFIAFELMKCLISLRPSLSEYHNAMGLILKRWNCWDEAEAHYKIAINGELTENIYKWNYGLLLEEGQKFDLALEQFLSASHNVDSKEPDYIFEAAYCYQKLGDYHNATINYCLAIEMDGDKSSYWIYYAEYLCQDLKEYDKSIKCFEKAIELENECNINYYYRFARYLRDFHQNYNLSQIYYKKCLSMNKEKKDLMIKGVNGSYGYLLFLMEEYCLSNHYLCLAQVSDPKNAWSFYYYGLLNIKHFDDKIKANHLLEKAIKVCTTHHSISKHLQRIKEVDPDNMWFHNKFELLLNQKFEC